MQSFSTELIFDFLESVKVFLGCRSDVEAYLVIGIALSGIIAIPSFCFVQQPEKHHHHD